MLPHVHTALNGMGGAFTFYRGTRTEGICTPRGHTVSPAAVPTDTPQQGLSAGAPDLLHFCPLAGWQRGPCCALGKPRVTNTGLCLGPGRWVAGAGPLWDPCGSGAFPGLLRPPGSALLAWATGRDQGSLEGGGCSWAFLMKGPQRATQGSLVGNSLPQLRVSSHGSRKGDPRTRSDGLPCGGPLPVYF